MSKVLSQTFFDRNPVTVCQELLGKFLVIKKKWNISKYIITEVEAYDGEEDEACHARHGKTERNAPMYSAPGCRYVYMIYGMYYMLNIVTGPGKHPSAILIRGLRDNEESWGILRKIEEYWKKGKEKVTRNKDFAWPGKITKNLWIDKRFNGKKANENSWLRVEESWIVVSPIKTAPRVGIDYASDEWKNKHWRFYADDPGLPRAGNWRF